MALRGAISRLRSGSYTATRKAQGSDDGHGRYVDDGAETVIPFVASIQPLDGKSLSDASSGQQVDDRIKIITTTELIARSENYQGDIVVYKGKPYAVTKVNTHESFGAGHYIIEASYTESP